MFRQKKLHDAAREGDVPAVKELIANKVDVNLKTYDNTPLHAAIYGEFERAIGLTMENTSNTTDYPQVVQILLENKADPSIKNGHGQPALHLAAFYSSSQIVKLLLASKADIKQLEDEYGMTPLITAASYNRPESGKIIETLLEHKADISAQDRHQRTALFQSTWTDFPVASVKTLIEHKADVNSNDKNGRGPLQNAARFNNPALVQLLLASNANIDRQDNRGRTPLHEVISHSHPCWGHSTALDMLVENGADLSKKDNEGISPLALAQSLGHRQAQTVISDKLEQSKRSFKK